MNPDAAEPLLGRLRAVVGDGHVLTAPQDLEPHVVDWRRRFQGRTLAVVRPRDTAEVAQVMRACAAARMPVIPQGGNTGQSGASVPVAGRPRNVILSLARLDRVRALDRANNTLTAEAGCILQTVQETAAAAGRFFPLSLGAEGSCQIGGTLATNAGGTAVLRYGNARELVLGLEVVLADGTVWDGLRGLRKDNSGYDLRDLFVGSEGTLGIITAAVLKLVAPPREKAVAWVAVPDLGRAVELLGLARDTLDSRLAAFEYLSRTQVDLVLRHVPGHRDPLPGAAGAAGGYVLVELADTVHTGRLGALLQQLLEQGVAQGCALDAVVATSEAQAQALWRLRHSVSEANRAHGISLNHDVAVPTSRVVDFVERATSCVRGRFPAAELSIVSHLGDGNVHFLAIFPRAFWSAQPDAESYGAQVREAVYEIAMACGGSFSAEHGVGQMLTAQMQRFKSGAELGLMRRLKEALDPAGLLNPGKVLP